MPVAGLVSKRYWWKTINTIRVGVKLDNTYYLDADGNTTPSISLSEIQVWLPLVDDQMLDRIDGLDGTDDLDQFAREIENELSQELSLSENAHIQYVTIQGTISELRHAAHERVVQTKVDTNYKDYRFTPGTGMDLKMHMTVNAVENFYTQGQGLIEGAARTEIVMLDNTPPVPFSDKFDVFHNIVKHTHYERSPHLSVGIGGILDEYSTENVQAKYYPDGTVWNSEYNFEITPNGGFTRSYSVEHDYSPTVGVTQTSFSNPDNLTAADLNTAVNTLNNIQTSLENNPPAS